MKLNVRWHDGFKREYESNESFGQGHEFGSDYVWIKIDETKEIWIPTRSVRRVKTFRDE